MDFWTECKQHPNVCTFGFVLGVLITLLLMWVYNYYYGECFMNPNAMNPDTKTLLAYQLMRRGYTPALAKKEAMCHNKMTHCQT